MEENKANDIDSNSETDMKIAFIAEKSATDSSSSEKAKLDDIMIDEEKGLITSTGSGTKATIGKQILRYLTHGLDKFLVTFWLIVNAIFMSSS